MLAPPTLPLPISSSPDSSHPAERYPSRKVLPRMDGSSGSRRSSFLDPLSTSAIVALKILSTFSNSREASSSAKVSLSSSLSSAAKRNRWPCECSSRDGRSFSKRAHALSIVESFDVIPAIYYMTTYVNVPVSLQPCSAPYVASVDGMYSQIIRKLHGFRIATYKRLNINTYLVIV